MRRLRSLLIRLVAPFLRTRRERELNAELDSHLQLHIDDNLRAGMTPDEARRQARLALGGVEQTKELVRDARGTFLDSVRQDVVFALRLMRRSPVVTAVAVLSLALAIGANTAIFSILDRLMLQTLPVREPDRLALLGPGSWTNPLWEQIRDRRELFDGALAWSSRRFDLSPGGQTEFADGVWVSGRFFDVLGVPPLLGRTLRPEDDSRDRPDGPVVVISHGFWQRRFHGAADAVGRTLTLDRIAFTIVGVMPPRFYGLTPGQAWDVAAPIGCEPLFRGPDAVLDTSDTWLAIMIRLKPNQTFEQGTKTLRDLQAQLREASLPSDGPPDRWVRQYLKDPFTLVPVGSGVRGVRHSFERPLLTLMVVVALVLLVACANIANLSLARAAARRQELGIRLALGATGWRLARLLLTESLIMAGGGAMLGLLFAQWAARFLVAQFSTPGSRLFLDLSLDWRVLAFTAAVAVGTAVLCGVAPSCRSARTPPGQALGADGRTQAGSGRQHTASALVIVQVALSLILVHAAGLFLRTFADLAGASLGFDSRPVLIATIDAQQGGVDAAARLDTYEGIRQAVVAVPGVADAAVSRFTPLNPGGSTAWPIELPGSTAQPAVAYVHRVSPGYFATYATRVTAGRDFTAFDRAGGPMVAIVNHEFVRRFFAGGIAIGQSIRPGLPAYPTLTIVGVVADARYHSLREPAPPTMYVPLAQVRDLSPFASLSVRSAGPPPATLARAVADAVARVNPRLALTFRPLDSQIGDRLVRERVMAMLGGFFGLLALLMAALGLYGVMSYSVRRRRSEIGIRMALGAAPAGVVWMVLTRAAWLVGLGVVIGVGVSLWAARLVESLLFGVKGRDPLTFAVAAAVLVATALVAGWLPARRASRIDPTTVLRES